MAWRPAKSLQVLKSQLDAAYPGWLFLGFIGDQSHASGPSDHNPNAAGVVCALDIGPGGGLAIHELANSLLANRHPDLKYIISNRRIAGEWTRWEWATYNGTDPHDTHIHVSVGRGPDGQSTQPYDDGVQWNLNKGGIMPEDAVKDLVSKANYAQDQRMDKIEKLINQVYNDFVPAIDKLKAELNRLNNGVNNLNKEVFDKKNKEN